MLLASFKTLFIVGSSILLSGCRGHGPLVDICVNNKPERRYECVDKAQKNYPLTWEQVPDNAVLFPKTEDLEAYMNWCETRRKP